MRDQGLCRYRIEVLGKTTLDTAAGRTDVYLVREHRHLTLNLAEVTVTIESAYAPGIGLIREQQRRQVRALGLIPYHSWQQLVRHD